MPTPHRMPVTPSEILDVATRIRSMRSDTEADDLLAALDAGDWTTSDSSVLACLRDVERQIEGDLLDGDAWRSPDDTGERVLRSGWEDVSALLDDVGDLVSRLRAVGHVASRVAS